MLRVTLSVALVVVLHASTLRAQPQGGVVTRSVPTGGQTGYVEVNLGLQATTTAFDVTTHPLTFVEPATVETNYSVRPAREFDLGGGVHITPRLAVGASLSRFEKSGDVTVDAQVPHPFFFNRARSVTGTASDLARLETAIHGKLVWMAQVGDGWLLSVSGGPSFFKASQDLVEDITIRETYPYDTATFAGAVSTRHTKSGLGFNVGADFTRLLTSHMGIGVAAVLSRARLTFDTAGDTPMRIDAGGIRIGGGLRFRF